jgi:hypothetical protein
MSGEEESTQRQTRGRALLKVLFAFLGATVVGFAFGLLRRRRSPELPEEITWEEAKVEG